MSGIKQSDILNHPNNHACESWNTKRYSWFLAATTGSALVFPPPFFGGMTNGPSWERLWDILVWQDEGAFVSKMKRNESYSVLPLIDNSWCTKKLSFPKKKIPTDFDRVCNNFCKWNHYLCLHKLIRDNSRYFSWFSAKINFPKIPLRVSGIPPWFVKNNLSKNFHRH